MSAIDENVNPSTPVENVDPATSWNFKIDITAEELKAIEAAEQLATASARLLGAKSTAEASVIHFLGTAVEKAISLDPKRAFDTLNYICYLEIGSFDEVQERDIEVGYPESTRAIGNQLLLHLKSQLTKGVALSDLEEFEEYVDSLETDFWEAFEAAGKTVVTVDPQTDALKTENAELRVQLAESAKKATQLESELEALRKNGVAGGVKSPELINAQARILALEAELATLVQAVTGNKTISTNEATTAAEYSRKLLVTLKSFGLLEEVKKLIRLRETGELTDDHLSRLPNMIDDFVEPWGTSAHVVNPPAPSQPTGANGGVLSPPQQQSARQPIANSTSGQVAQVREVNATPEDQRRGMFRRSGK
jgi:hypothetical protein